MNKRVTIGIGFLGAALLAGGVVLTPPSPVTLTLISLNTTPVYVATFMQTHGTSTTEVPITKAQYDALALPSAVAPVLNGYTFIGANKGFLYTNGKRTISPGEYTVNGDGKATVYVVGEKEEKSVDATLIQNNVLSSAGVQAAKDQL